MFLTKVKDALEKGEADVAKGLALFLKDAPMGEAAAEACVAVFSPGEAANLQKLFTATNGLVTAANTVNSQAATVTSENAVNAADDATLATGLKGFIADIEAALTGLGIIKKPAATAAAAPVPAK